MSLLGHLEDLRKMLVRVLLSLIPTSILGWYVRDTILDWLIKPIRDVSPDFKLSSLGVVSPFFVYLKIAMAVGFVIALPYILYQVWSFVLPALKSKEKRVLGTIVPISVLLFIVGIVFAYFTVFQIGVRFFWFFAESSGIQQIYGMDEYLSFCISFLLPFGLIFEMPIVFLVLAKMGLVSPKFLASKRRYALLIIFVIAALLTPGPDVISQLMMAAPMYILFELSIFLARFVYTPKAVDDDDDDDDNNDDGDHNDSDTEDSDEQKSLGEKAQVQPDVQQAAQQDGHLESQSSENTDEQQPVIPNNMPPDAIFDYKDDDVEYVSVYKPIPEVEQSLADEAGEADGVNEVKEDVKPQAQLGAAEEVDTTVGGEERLAQLLDDIQKRGASDKASSAEPSKDLGKDPSKEPSN